MPTLTLRRFLSVTASALLVAGLTAHLSGYSLGGRTWGTSQVTYYVNPSNNTLSQSAVIAAIQQAAHIDIAENIDHGPAAVQKPIHC